MLVLIRMRVLVLVPVLILVLVRVPILVIVLVRTAHGCWGLREGMCVGLAQHRLLILILVLML